MFITINYYVHCYCYWFSITKARKWHSPCPLQLQLFSFGSAGHPWILAAMSQCWDMSQTLSFGSVETAPGTDWSSKKGLLEAPARYISPTWHLFCYKAYYGKSNDQLGNLHIKLLDGQLKLILIHCHFQGKWWSLVRKYLIPEYRTSLHPVAPSCIIYRFWPPFTPIVVRWLSPRGQNRAWNLGRHLILAMMIWVPPSTGSPHPRKGFCPRVSKFGSCKYCEGMGESDDGKGKGKSWNGGIRTLEKCRGNLDDHRLPSGNRGKTW